MKRRGFSFVELLIAIAIISILVAMAMGPLHDALRSARESSALASIKAIHAAQAQYVTQTGRFAASLSDLGPPLKLLGADLAGGVKSGYKFTLAKSDSGYWVRAEPVDFGASGRRSYYADETLVTRESLTRDTAGPEHPPVTN